MPGQFKSVCVAEVLVSVRCSGLSVNCDSGLARAQMQQVKLWLWTMKAQLRRMKHERGKGRDK